MYTKFEETQMTERYIIISCISLFDVILSPALLPPRIFRPFPLFARPDKSFPPEKRTVAGGGKQTKIL